MTPPPVDREPSFQEIPLTVERARNMPLPAWAIIAALSAVVGLVLLTLRTEGHLDEAAARAVERHTETELDRAHPTLTHRYVPRPEHERAVSETKSDIRSMRETLERIQADLARLAEQKRR